MNKVWAAALLLWMFACGYFAVRQFAEAVVIAPSVPPPPIVNDCNYNDSRGPTSN